MSHFKTIISRKLSISRKEVSKFVGNFKEDVVCPANIRMIIWMKYQIMEEKRKYRIAKCENQNCGIVRVPKHKYGKQSKSMMDCMSTNMILVD